MNKNRYVKLLNFDRAESRQKEIEKQKDALTPRPEKLEYVAESNGERMKFLKSELNQKKILHLYQIYVIWAK